MKNNENLATTRQISYYNDLANKAADRGENIPSPNWLTISKTEASEMISDLIAHLAAPAPATVEQTPEEYMADVKARHGGPSDAAKATLARLAAARRNPNNHNR